ncbi:MAG: CPBP family intramembrane glutamic endopeptidase [Calditrichota bacterium]
MTQDESARLFLEREYGVQRSSDLARDSLPLWSWRVTFRAPDENAEYSVNLSPSGEIVGFARIIPKTNSGPSLSAESARILAEAFLRKQLNFRPEEWELLTSDNLDQGVRRNHYLTYQLKGVDFRGAFSRLKVAVEGAEIGGFQRFVQVPESWIQESKRSRNLNDTAQNAAELLGVGLFLIAVAVTIRRNRAGRIVWRFPLIMGVSLAAVNLTGGINLLPLQIDALGALKAEGRAYVESLLLILLNAGLTGTLGMILAAAGESWYREAYPRRLQLGQIGTVNFWRYPETTRATLAGYGLALFTIGFITAFGILGKKVGIWAPLDVGYNRTASTLFPGLHPVTLALGTALLEECWFRLFGITYLGRVFRSRVVGVVITAVIWGYWATGFPQSPDLIIGLEWSVIGLAAGWLFLRYGWWAAIVWRLTIVTWLTGQCLTAEGSSIFTCSKWFIIIILFVPLMLTAFGWLTREKLKNPNS